LFESLPANSRFRQHSFHPELQASIDMLKEAIAKGTANQLPALPSSTSVTLPPFTESWETKGKFPPAIKPVLAEVAIKAIHLDEYDEHFFNLMPVLFPYNKFTMTVCCRFSNINKHTHTYTYLETHQANGFHRSRTNTHRTPGVIS
jgi:hypothetical protein